jgi:hypothetical protein
MNVQKRYSSISFKRLSICDQYKWSWHFHAVIKQMQQDGMSLADV